LQNKERPISEGEWLLMRQMKREYTAAADAEKLAEGKKIQYGRYAGQ
jgi:hypothetical protein